MRPSGGRLRALTTYAIPLESTENYRAIASLNEESLMTSNHWRRRPNSERRMATVGRRSTMTAGIGARDYPAMTCGQLGANGSVDSAGSLHHSDVLPQERFPRAPRAGLRWLSALATSIRRRFRSPVLPNVVALVQPVQNLNGTTRHTTDGEVILSDAINSRRWLRTSCSLAQ